MRISVLPVHIQKFVEAHVFTIGHLELLLFLYDERDQFWSIAQLRDQMRTNDSLVADQIKDLTGLISFKGSDGYRFLANVQNLEIVEHLSRLYKVRRMTVIDCIYNRRIHDLKDFANAFRVTKASNS